MKRLLLVGGGHAHLFVLEAFARAPLAGVELVLVSPQRLAPYSGMMPGVIAGHYDYEQGCVDLLPLARAAGCRWLETRVVAFDPAAGGVRCADGTRLDYDLLSLDTGITPGACGVPGVAEHAIGVKPIDRYVERWRRLCGEPRGLRICVVGGGAAGAEVIAAMHHRRAAAGHHDDRFTLVHERVRLLDTLPPRAGALYAWLLARRGVTVHLGREVVRLDAERVHLADGSAIDADFTVWATGAAAPAWAQASGFATDERGFLRVDACLRSCSHANVFAAGDVASIEGQSRPRSGVYAVRAGPPLAHNLRAALTGDALEVWTPQRRALALLSTGGRHAVGVWGPLVWHGDWVWRWKDRIDRRFVARFDWKAGRKE